MRHIHTFESFLNEGAGKKYYTIADFPHGAKVYIDNDRLGPEVWRVIPHPAYPKTPYGKVFMAPIESTQKYLGPIEYTLKWLNANVTKIEIE